MKKFIKRVLVHFRILQNSEPRLSNVSNESNVVEIKKIPDFDIANREKPTIIMRAGKYIEQLDNYIEPKIAIQVHAFFMDVMDEVAGIMSIIPYPFDCYVSTDTEEKKIFIEELLNNRGKIRNLQVDVMDNRGRDVGPFLQQMEPVLYKYKYIAHLHTKKSKHTDFGDDWRHFLFRNMFGGEEAIRAILEKFENDDNLGLVIPEIYPIVRELIAWDNSKDDVQRLLKSMGLTVELTEIPICPAGDIFWAKTAAVKVLFDKKFQQSDFQEEAGQLNYTLAHVIERIWCYLSKAQGYRYEVCINGIEESKKDILISKRGLIFACSNELKKIDFKNLKRICNDFEFVLAIVKNDQECIKIKEELGINSIILPVDNNKIMWKAGLMQEKSVLKELDEIALLDNSGIGPLFDLLQIMNYMSAKEVAAWSVFKTNLSNAIFSLFNMRQLSYDSIQLMVDEDVVLEEAYIKESAYIGEWLFTSDAVSELAYDYIILHSPYIKKKSINCLRKNEKKLLKDFLKGINMIV